MAPVINCCIKLYIYIFPINIRYPSYSRLFTTHWWYQSYQLCDPKSQRVISITVTESYCEFSQWPRHGTCLELSEQIRFHSKNLKCWLEMSKNSQHYLDLFSLRNATYIVPNNGQVPCVYIYIWINIRYDNPALSWAYIPWEQTIQLPVPGRLFGWTVRIARAFSEVLS